MWENWTRQLAADPADVLSAVLSPNNQRRADVGLCSRPLGFQVPLLGKDCPPEAALYF